MRRRMLNPEFFTDADIVASLDPWGRLLYQGLWCVAEDSGVFEVNALTLKMKIFPGDNLDLSNIRGYIQTLIDQRKIVLFEFHEKTYGWLKNFQKHQKLDKPSPPSLPLPEWIKWHGEEEFEKQRHKWYYEVLPMSTTSPRQDLGQSTLEVKRSEVKLSEVKGNEMNHDDDDARTRESITPEIDQKISAIVQTLEQEFGRLPSPTETEKIVAFYTVDGMDAEVVCEAIKRARLNGAFNTKYVLSTLTNWQSQKIINMSGIEIADQQWEKRKEAKARGPTGNRSATDTTASSAKEKYADLIPQYGQKSEPG